MLTSYLGAHFDAHQLWTVLWVTASTTLGLSVLLCAALLLARFRDWQALKARIACGPLALSDVWRYLDDKVDQHGNPVRGQFDPIRDGWMYHEPRLVLTWAQSGQPLSLLHVYVQAGFTPAALYAHLHGDAPISADTARVMAALRQPAPAQSA